MSFNKFTYLYYHHPLQKVGIERPYLNIIKAIYDKLIANIILNGEKFESTSRSIRNKKRMPTLSIFFLLSGKSEHPFLRKGILEVQVKAIG